MAARKLQQEMEKTFKKVGEGRETFQQIYDKIQDCDNPSQKEKLEDQLKREIKKLQRHRDQIKTWAASNEIKDKKPLLEQRKLIETEMEKFKAVEKEMKTKAFSKEGLSQSAKLDPKEKDKAEAGDFLTEQIDELGRQIETLEAEEESLQVTVKKGKKDTSKADRLNEISNLIERHRWHQSQLELANRALENGSVEADQINNLKEDIKYYVQENSSVEFIEDDTIYDELNLDEEGGNWGVPNEADRVPSHEASSQPHEEAIIDGPPEGAKAKVKSGSEGAATGGISARRSSNSFKSPLPTLSTLHAPSASNASVSSASGMKSIPLPTRPVTETLQYASAAKTAATEKTIAPLPPPPGISPQISALPAAPGSKPASIASPLPSTVTPVTQSAQPAPKSGQQPSLGTASGSSIPPTPILETSDTATPPPPPPKSRSPLPKTRAAQQQREQQAAVTAATAAAAAATAAVASVASAASASNTSPEPEQPKTPPPLPSAADDARGGGPAIESGEEESIYHLPPGLQELIQSFEMTRSAAAAAAAASNGTSTASSAAAAAASERVQRLLNAGGRSLPDAIDTEKPRSYKPAHKYSTPRYYPQEPVSVVDDPALFQRIDTDTLFFLFYYRQGTYLQYAAARALKQQSWRFHKQYQTWFQRHEEPKLISDEFEQGTYRFFDYESTWMNRRKADFKFAYKFLEDDL